MENLNESVRLEVTLEPVVDCLFVCAATSFAYSEFFFISSSCDPCSTIFPSLTTAMTSAFLMVDKRWAMMIVVLLPETKTSSKACCTANSDSESSALVASSRRRIFGFFNKILAIAILCF